MEYNKIITGFVVQRYRDGRCTHQEFIAGDEVCYEDPISGESVEADIHSEKYQPMEMIQPRLAINHFIQDGGLDTEGVVEDATDLLQQATTQMDRCGSRRVIDSILFEAHDGKFYAGVIKGEFTQQDLGDVEQALNDVLGENAQELDLADDMAIEDRVGAKMKALVQCRTDC